LVKRKVGGHNYWLTLEELQTNDEEWWFLASRWDAVFQGGSSDRPEEAPKTLQEIATAAENRTSYVCRTEVWDASYKHKRAFIARLKWEALQRLRQQGMTLASNEGLGMLGGAAFGKLLKWAKDWASHGYRLLTKGMKNGKPIVSIVDKAGKEIASGTADDVAKKLDNLVPKAPKPAPNNGKLVFDPATKSWTSPGGLVYEQGSVHGN
jgi:hypothetical protein